MSLFFTPDRPLNPPEEVIVRELPNCDACGDETDFRTELGIYMMGLTPKSMVCSHCLSTLHEELKINQTE